MLARFRSAGLIWPTLLMLPMLAFLLGLGSWQMQRKAWKEALIAQIEARIGAPPGDLRKEADERLSVETGGAAGAGLAARLETLEYTPLRVTGVFDPSGERYLYAPDPRLGPGYHVFTPMRIEGRDLVVMVNRGYVPDDKRDPAARTPEPAGPRTVVGLARAGGRKGGFTPDNDLKKNIWFWPDLPAMSGLPPARDPKGAGVLPFYLDALAEPANPGGWPKGGTTQLVIANRHLEYALTWYGLGATLVGVYLAFAISRLRAAPPQA